MGGNEEMNHSLYVRASQALNIHPNTVLRVNRKQADMGIYK